MKGKSRFGILLITKATLHNKMLTRLTMKDTHQEPITLYSFHPFLTVRGHNISFLNYDNIFQAIYIAKTMAILSFNSHEIDCVIYLYVPKSTWVQSTIMNFSLIWPVNFLPDLAQ